MSLPANVRIYEVGPRDGLQNDAEVSTDFKVELINRLSETGLTHIESGSFVSPKAIPQMADSAEVMARIKREDGVIHPVLVPNEKGLDIALDAGAQEIAIFTAASEEFNQKNIKASIEESLERFKPVMAKAQQNNIKVRGYVSCIAGFQAQGDVPPEKVAEVTKDLIDMGCYEVSLGDTTGMATPDIMEAVIDACTAKGVKADQLALHCHNTRGPDGDIDFEQALQNIEAGLRKGVSVVDSSVAGLGGCPAVKGASGNVATEDVVTRLHDLGIDTGVDLEKLLNVVQFVSTQTGRKPVSAYAQNEGLKKNTKGKSCPITLR